MYLDICMHWIISCFFYCILIRKRIIYIKKPLYLFIIAILIYHFLIRLLIKFVKSGEYTWRGYFFSALLLVVALTQSLLLHQYFHETFLMGMRLRSTIISIVYKKVSDFYFLLLFFVLFEQFHSHLKLVILFRYSK